MIERRPNIEYQMAYDLCALLAHQQRQQTAIFASSPLHKRELMERIPGGIVASLPEGKFEQSADFVVWAEPSRQQSEAALAQIQRTLSPNGLLAVLVSGRLATRLTEWRENLVLPQGETPLGWVQTRALLSGFTIKQEYTFRGATTLLWDYLAQVAVRVGRNDLADRLTYKMRAGFVVGRWQQPLSTLGLIVAQR